MSSLMNWYGFNGLLRSFQVIRMPCKSRCLKELESKKLMDHIHSNAQNARQKGQYRAIIDEIIVMLLLETGIKPLECCLLRIEDTPPILQEDTLKIRNNDLNISRTIPLRPKISLLIKKYIENYRETANREDPLFINERGNPLSYISLYSKLRRIGQQSGIGKITPNCLRHTCLVRMFSLDNDLNTVQRQFGHKNVKTTARHLFTQKHCDACDKEIPKHLFKKIDSGHSLCPTCLHELNRY